MPEPPARPKRQRIQDTLHRLDHDIDAWVATADPKCGTPHLVPLSFHWDGETVLIATAARSVTGRNLAASGAVRIGLGTTRDVVIIEGEVERTVAPDEIAGELGDTFAARIGFDPRRTDSPFCYFHIRPRRIQTWREENELEGRLLMRDGAWLSAD